MSTKDLQDHFDRNPIQYLGRGCQMVVHGTDRLVIKELKLRGALASMPNAGTILQIVRGAHEKGLDCLGELVVPYALPEEINAHSIQRGFWPWTKKREEMSFKKPVVQKRVDDSQTLSSKITAAVEGEDSHALEGLLQAFIEVRRGLIGVGAFPFDMNGGNFVLDGAHLQVRDVGSLLIGNTTVKNLLRAKVEAKKMCEGTKNLYEMKMGSMRRNPKVRRAMEALKSDLDWQFSNRVRASLGKTRQKSCVHDALSFD